MSDDVIKHLGKLSITDHAENDAPNSHSAFPAQVHAVAGLDLALASLRELIGQYTFRQRSHLSIHGSVSVCA